MRMILEGVHFLLIQHSKYSAMLSKTQSYRLLFWRFCPSGCCYVDILFVGEIRSIRRGWCRRVPKKSWLDTGFNLPPLATCLAYSKIDSKQKKVELLKTSPDILKLLCTSSFISFISEKNIAVTRRDVCLFLRNPVWFS